MSLGNDEKKFLELREGFVSELEELNQQMEELMERRNILVALLDGRLENNEVDDTLPSTNPEKLDIDYALQDFIRSNGSTKREHINDFFTDWNLSQDDIRRALERCKRRGLIKVKGKSRAAVWTAVK